MKKFLLAMTSAVLLSGPSQSEGLLDMSDEERSAFRNEVRAYLMDNPEVLMEAIRVLEGRQQQAQAEQEKALVSALADDIYNDGYSYVGGNPDGDVTIVEFLDYRCGYCRKAHPEINELLERDGNIRFIVKEFPILGEDSIAYSRLAIATLHMAGPDAYKRLGDFLFEFNGKLTDKNMPAILTKLKIDPKEVLPYLDNAAVSAQIGASHELAGKLSISGTPTFAIGTELLKGYVPLETMLEIVAYHRSQQN